MPAPTPTPAKEEFGRPITQYEALFGSKRGSAALPESIASRALAGAGAALIVTTALAMARRRGFRTPGSVIGVAAGCGLAGPFMPPWAEVERRSPL
jgi:hypothetical protein